MSLADRIRRLEIEAEGHLIAIPQTDGAVERFHEDAVMDALLSSFDRGRAKHAGELTPEPHPLLDALYNASEESLEELARTEGTCILMLAGEEEVLRGDRARSGTPMSWNGEGAVCE